MARRNKPIKQKPQRSSIKDQLLGAEPGLTENFLEQYPRGKARPIRSRRHCTASAATAAATAAAPHVHRPQEKQKPVAISGAQQSKRRKRSAPLLPNARLYQPAPHRHRIAFANPHLLPTTPVPADRPTRLPWPGATSPGVLGTASNVIVELTQQIATHQPRPASKKSRKKRDPISLSSTAKASIVVNLPKVDILPELSSPERIRPVFPKGICSDQGDSFKIDELPNPTTLRSSSAFKLCLERLNSPVNQSSDAGSNHKQAYNPTSSYFRQSQKISLQKTKESRICESKVKRQELVVTNPRSAVDDDYSASLRAESLETERAIAKTSSLYRYFLDGNHNKQFVEPKEQISKKNKSEAKMSGKERGGQHSASPEDFSDGNETLSAPSEFLAEFLSAIMQRKYVSALKYCKLILQYEPNNVTAKEFHPLLEEKLKIADRDEGSSGAEPPAEGPHTDPSDGTTPEHHHTDDKEDEGSSYNSDDSSILDDELEEEESARGASGDGAAAADSPLTSSRTRSSKRATDSDRSLPSSGGETDNWAANLSGSGCEDDDSCRLDVDDDNGNAVSVTVSARHPAASASAAAAAARFAALCEENDNAPSAASSASNDNYRKQQEELRRSKIQQLRSQYVHTVN